MKTLKAEREFRFSLSRRKKEEKKKERGKEREGRKAGTGLTVWQHTHCQRTCSGRPAKVYAIGGPFRKLEPQGTASEKVEDSGCSEILWFT